MKKGTGKLGRRHPTPEEGKTNRSKLLPHWGEHSLDLTRDILRRLRSVNWTEPCPINELLNTNSLILGSSHLEAELCWRSRPGGRCSV